MAAMRRAQSQGTLPMRLSTEQVLLPWLGPPTAEVNEVHTMQVFEHAINKETVLRSRSRRAQREREAALAEARARMMKSSQSTLARSGAATAGASPPARPNERFGHQNRQLKHQMMQGDGRAKMLSRVFVNGEWIYAA
uniref:Uncharacterized protein n=1 Tax=Alexandrium catenella TaxID=2925 RepID=A0A7S1WMI7_ALECA